MTDQPRTLRTLPQMEEIPTFSFNLRDPDFLLAVAKGLPSQHVERTLLITGPPRSGTSMVAGILWHHGVHLGSRMHGPKGHNERGLFEDEIVVQFNEHILASAGGNWVVPPPEEGLGRISADKLLGAWVRYEARDVWGVKDGRLCLTIPLWEPVVRDLNPHLVVCHRNPMAVAQSMCNVWQLPVSTGLHVHACYVERLARWVEEHEDCPVLHISYEEVLGDPLGQAGRLCAFAGVEMDEVIVKEFVDPDLQHF